MRVLLRIILLPLGLLGFWVCQAEAGEQVQGIPILVYHRFDATVSGLTTVRTSDFAGQLAWLRAQNISLLPLHEVVDRLKHGEPPSRSPAVVITADDGHRSVFSEMYPLIQRYGVHVTLFIYPSAISNSVDALTWGELGEMLKSGWVDVQSHTYWHPNFHIEKRRLAPAAYEAFARAQLMHSKARLEERLGIDVDLLAWPFGIYDMQLEQLAMDCGYAAAFGIDRSPVRAGADLYALPRYLITDADRGERFSALIAQALERNAPQ
jgi:peptidoglycan/xylan/chitin deacetylase (PgdA/CDA1 family)